MERTITLQKDSHNHVGFMVEKGQIVSLVKDTSACRNGVLTNHHVIEVNGRCVVGLPDKQLIDLIASSPQTITITIMLSLVFNHLIKGMGSDMKKHMDRSTPEY